MSPSSNPTKPKLILSFLGMATAIGTTFLVAHLILGDSRSSLAYIPFSIVASLLAYAWYRRFGSGPGTGGVIELVAFCLGVAFAPVMFVEVFNTLHETIDPLTSASNVRTAKSDYVAFKNPDVMPEKALIYEDHYRGSKSQTYNVLYTALIPVRTGRADTLFDTWIVMSEHEYYAKDVDSVEIARRENAFYEWCGERLNQFPYDSVVFYDKSNMHRQTVLALGDYPIPSGSFFLEPVFVTYEAYGRPNRYIVLGIFVLLTLFFWAGVNARFRKPTQDHNQELEIRN